VANLNWLRTQELKRAFLCLKIKQRSITRPVWKVRGLTLLLWVGILWKCGDGLSFEVPPLASDALLTTLHPLLENVLQTVDHFQISCLEAPFSWLKKPEVAWGKSELYGGCCNGVPPIHFFQAEHKIQFTSCPIRFLGFSNHENGAQRQEISKWSTVCSTFSRSGWSVVRSASLAKRGSSKKRPSPHLHKVPTRSNKVSPRTLQMALVYTLLLSPRHYMEASGHHHAPAVLPPYPLDRRLRGLKGQSEQGSDEKSPCPNLNYGHLATWDFCVYAKRHKIYH
jgi:hypothetical protein